MYLYEDETDDLKYRVVFLENRITKINDKLSNAYSNIIMSLMATVMNVADLKGVVGDLEEQVFRPDLKNRRFRKRKPNLIRGKIRTKNLKLKNATNQ